jgi:1-deoxy-D-xylulose-5-phosphate reductoisomerase
MGCENIAVLGSTGSVGRQVIDTARHLNVKIDVLTADKNIELLEAQAREFNPASVAVNDETAAGRLRFNLRDTNIRVLGGKDGIAEVAAENNADTVFNSITGIAGLVPTLSAVNAKKNVALANKETLVVAGDTVMNAAKENGVTIFPVDSEHSAIFQSYDGRNKIKKILLTCSGGPFFGKTIDELNDVGIDDVLNHPTWKMGTKITVDCADLINKGFEVIEAAMLFGVGPEQIEVLIHRESIIHSMVEYIDNAVIAQLSVPDMRLCVGYAMTYPERKSGLANELDFSGITALTFHKPDTETFSLLPLAYEALRLGGIIPAVLNGANETAVGWFLSGKIKFTDIFWIVRTAVNDFKKRNIAKPTLADIISADIDVRQYMEELYKRV